MLRCNFFAPDKGQRGSQCVYTEYLMKRRAISQIENFLDFMTPTDGHDATLRLLYRDEEN